MELVKLEMTPKERKIAYARGEEVDRIPTSLSAGETAPPLYGISVRDYYFSADAMVEVESRLAEDFQADNIGDGTGTSDSGRSTRNKARVSGAQRFLY